METKDRETNEKTTVSKVEVETTDGDHPVWVVYDLQRTALLNCKYYARRAVLLQRTIFWLDVIVAVSAPSSAVAGIWFLQTPYGHEIFRTFGAIAAIVSVVKPFMRLPQRLKAVEQCLAGYRALNYDVDTIVVKIRSEGVYSPAAQRMFNRAQEKKGHLLCNPPEHEQSDRLRRRYAEEVKRELPMDRFYIPRKEGNDDGSTKA